MGPYRVLLGLVMFIDESYNKKSISCEAMYGDRHTVENFNDHCSLLMIALCSATLLHIDESKRFKKGAYRFWGCIPKYDNAAAKAEGKSDEWIRRRSAEVHSAAMHPVVERIREFFEAQPYLFAVGVTRLAAGRPAIIIGDQPGQDKLLSKVMKGCSVCCAPFDELDSTDKEWLLRESCELLQSMQRIAAECLNEAGEVKHGKRQVLADWERDNRIHVGSNAILELVDLGFDALLQLPRCFLHLVILGLFGHHIIKAILHLMSRKQEDTRLAGSTAPKQRTCPGWSARLGGLVGLAGRIGMEGRVGGHGGQGRRARRAGSGGHWRAGLKYIKISREQFFYYRLTWRTFLVRCLFSVFSSSPVFSKFSG